MKSEQILMSVLFVACTILVVTAMVIVFTAHTPAVQLAHAIPAHLAHMASTAG